MPGAQRGIHWAHMSALTFASTRIISEYGDCKRRWIRAFQLADRFARALTLRHRRELIVQLFADSTVNLTNLYLAGWRNFWERSGESLDEVNGAFCCIRVAVVTDKILVEAIGIGNINVLSYVNGKTVKCRIKNVLLYPRFKKESIICWKIRDVWYESSIWKWQGPIN